MKTETEIRSPRRYGRGGLPMDVVKAIHAEYVRTGSLSVAGEKFGRKRSTVAGILSRHGLYQYQPPTNPGQRRDPRTSQFVAGPKLTDAQIDELVAREKTLRMPQPIRKEWRQWPIEKKAWLIAKLRARFASQRCDRPTTPFSANVEPFDYTTPRAWEIIRKVNLGLTSRQWKERLFFASQGVIWADKLWFWVSNSQMRGGGAYYAGSYVPGTGRKPLHWEIWETVNGRPVPPDHVVQLIDGNANNLASENLRLRSRNDLCRSNQARGLKQKSRRLTAALLQRHEKKDENEHHPLHQLKR